MDYFGPWVFMWRLFLWIVDWRLSFWPSYEKGKKVFYPGLDTLNDSDSIIDGWLTCD